MLASPRANARRPNYVHTSIYVVGSLPRRDPVPFVLPRCTSIHVLHPSRGLRLAPPAPLFFPGFFCPLAFFTNGRPGALRRLCTCGPFFVDRTDVQAGGAVRPSSANEVQVFGGDHALRAHVAGVHDARECVTGAAQSVREKKQILGVFFFSRNLA